MYFLIGVAAISFLLGLYVVIHNPKSNLNRLFFLSSFFSTLWIAANIGTGIFVSHFWIKSAYAFGSLATACAFLWVLYLIWGEKTLKYVYIVSIFAGVFFVLPYIDGLILRDIRSVSLGQFEGDFGILFPVYTAYQFGLLLSQIIITFIAFRKATGIRKEQLRYVHIGILLSAIIISLVSFVLPLIGILDFTYLDSPSFIIFLSFVAYSMTRYRLMDIKLIVTKSILYFLMIALVSSFFVFTTFLTTDVLAVSKGGNIGFSLLASFIIVVFIEPLKKLLSRITDDIFYKDKIDYDKILTKLGLIVAKEIDLEILLTQVTQGLLNELKLKRVDLILHLENNFYTLNSSGLTQVQVNPDVVTYLKTNNEITILEELRRKAYDMPEGIARKQLESIAAVFEQMKWEMVAPVIIEKELSAIIGLDSKLSGDIYNKDDVNFFTILAPQIAVAIEKSKLYEEVDKFNAQLQEKIDRATKKLRQVNLDLESRNKFLTTTQNISNLISRSLDINHIIQIIADSIASELGYIGGLLSFVGPQGKYLYPAAITRSPAADKALALLPKHPSEYKTSLASKENYGAQCFLSGSAITSGKLSDFICPPVPKDVVERIQEILGIQTVVGVPIYTENQIIGVIDFMLSVPEKEISRLDYEMMNNLADQIGIVYRNVKLYQELQNTNAELQQANTHLKQLDTAKSEFLSIASHQLRTPISAVKGYLSMLLEGDFGKLQPEQTKIITDVFESSSRLARLINIFLNVSRIESGRFKLTLAPTDMNTIVEGVVKELQQQAKIKNLQLILELPKKPVVINVDSDKIREVVLNLIDNAIKYTQQGSITISQELRGNEFHFQTKDTGMGILPEEVGGLFKKFVRGTGVAQVNTQGSGLGLYIAQRVVGEHGGKIWVESEGVGKGSTFQFTLPVSTDKTIIADQMQKKEEQSAKPEKAAKAEKPKLITKQ
jgi:signal transduction histidine kinase